MKKLSWFIFSLLLATSCLDEPDCFQLHNDVLGVTFRVIGTGQGDSVLLKNFIKEGENNIITSFNAKLNYFEKEGVLIFDGENDKKNFLAFGYTVKNQFISEDCGSSFELSDLRILDHDFDSVRIVNSTPTKGVGTNIEIYRCPETDTLTLNFNQLFARSDGIIISSPRSSFISHPFESITLDYSDIVFSGRSATVKLPVNLNENESAYVFKTDVSQDTLVVRYSLVTEQRYKACGVQTFVTDLRVREHTFDSINFGLDALDEPVRSLLDPQVANLRIFDCPKTNLLQVAFKKGTATQVVNIKSITADHAPGNLIKPPYSGSSVVLPVDLASDVSTFYIQYEDDTIDTLSIRYTRTELTPFNACENPVITNIAEVTDIGKINVLPTRTTLQFPTETNVEITVD
ncbi:DUF6452 family protein [Chryseolinea sp. H1M3-3]|uniref:DUF6452 family protein n=1 Tax=Chryseolinea sp. H1M3-3 TaxID=3034144 RepID=UPI0023EBB593|nr:DUF6452 family protein [Chryseolinea sp. H1M3-3]